jgi:hypothetical protein
MKTQKIVEDKLWNKVSALLPEDLQESARTHRALLRAREVSDAEGLMRMFLAYAAADFPMKDIAAWARSQNIATMTAPSFFHRLKQAKDWLRVVLTQVLERRMACLPPGAKLPEGMKFRIADATVITGPAAKGTEWRVHTVIDPRTACITSIELTDEHGGEGFSRLPAEPQEVLLGDQIYSVARSIASVKQRGADMVVRLNPRSIRLCNKNREVVPVYMWDSRVPQTGVVSFSLLVPVPPEGKGEGTQSAKGHKTTYKPWKLTEASDWIPVRVIASRTMKGEVIWILTTLSEEIADDVTVMELYRIRWQVELCFKRLKSLLHLDTLPSRRGPTAQSWILARLLAAALAQQLLEPVPSFSPWGYPLRQGRLRA